MKIDWNHLSFNPLVLTAASVADAEIHKKYLGLVVLQTYLHVWHILITSNEEMSGVIKIVKSLEESGSLIKGVSKTIENEAKEQKGGFLSMLLGKSGHNQSTTRFLMLPHLLSNLKIQKVYQNEPKFKGVYSRNSLSKIEDGTYVINLDEYKSIAAHWIAFYVNAENVTHVDSFGVEQIPQFIASKNIMTNIYRIQACNSII